MKKINLIIFLPYKYLYRILSKWVNVCFVRQSFFLHVLLHIKFCDFIILRRLCYQLFLNVAMRWFRNGKGCYLQTTNVKLMYGLSFKIWPVILFLEQRLEVVTKKEKEYLNFWKSKLGWLWNYEMFTFQDGGKTTNRKMAIELYIKLS